MPRTGAWTGCPDIIPSGQTLPANPLTTFGSAAAYATDMGGVITTNNVNYIYLRGKNLSGSDIPNGVAYLFYCPSGICLWPQQWTMPQYQIPGTNGKPLVAFPALAGQVGVTPNPFVWENPPTPPDGQHFCLVTMVGASNADITAIYTAAQSVYDMASLGAWIYNNGGAGWRNVTTTSTGAADFSTATTWTNRGPEGTVNFRIVCKNLPAGSAVAFSAPVATGGDPISLPKVVVPIPVGGKAGDIVPSFDAGLTVKVPAGYTSPIYYQWFSNGFPKSQGFNLTIQALVISTGSDALANHPVNFAMLVGEDAHHFHPKVGLVQGFAAFAKSLEAVAAADDDGDDDPFGPPDVPTLPAAVIGSHTTMVP